jgi:hypothetical protein
VDQVFFPEILQYIRKRFGTDPAEPQHNIIEPDLPVVADDTDNEDRPFFCDDIDDAFERTEADTITFFLHSHFKTINWTPLILPN